MFSSNATQVSSANYIEDVFSTYLYTGNGSTQTITNNIDLSGKGGLVWLKNRSSTYSHRLFDTARGATQAVASNITDAQFTQSGLTAFNTTGFDIGSAAPTNDSGLTFASWTFRKQAKFFDVVTYTGNATTRTIAHNLGSVPGCIMIKRTDDVSDWTVYHRGVSATIPADYNLVLNSTAARNSSQVFNFTPPTSTEFTIYSSNSVNASGGTYVAYLFAHDAGGFGLTGTDNVISCGSYTGNGAAGGQLINLGYEAQWVMIKKTSSTGSWMMFDTMREWSVNGDYGSDKVLWANLSGAENDFIGGEPSSLGFTPIQDNVNQSGATYIYIAIRRGPMKVPTSGTSVFSPNTTTNDTVISTTGFPVDLCIEDIRTPSSYPEAFDRLRGSGIRLLTSSTDAEGNTGTNPQFQSNTGVTPGRNGSGVSCILWNFRRAPSFFDEVCYTGTGSATTVAHNLGVAPELIIIKKRSNTSDWAVLQTGVQKQLYLNGNYAGDVVNATYFGNDSVYVAPTSTVFSLGSSSGVNGVSGQTFVAYLFATCAGVSKVGSYTGTGTTKQIDCGFAAGARFVLIKRTDSTGDWYVWDSERGIVSGNDPYLLLNSTAAEVTNTDYVDTYSAGFEISSTAPAAINASGGTFIFLAIA